jgi:hypothetical protein
MPQISAMVLRTYSYYLAIAGSGYRTQSQSLHIPDRFGFFSSAPPRLQVEEGAFFAQMLTMICYAIMTAWFVISTVSSPKARPFAFAVALNHSGDCHDRLCMVFDVYQTEPRAELCVERLG